MDEYKARQKAERARIAKLRKLRLAAEAKAAGRPEPMPKPGGGKGKTKNQRHRSASPVKKRSMVISNHKTSLTLEDGFWVSLKEIAAHEELPVAQLVARIDRDRQHANLSSAIRLYVLDHYRLRASEAAPGGKANT